MGVTLLGAAGQPRHLIVATGPRRWRPDSKHPCSRLLDSPRGLLPRLSNHSFRFIRIDSDRLDRLGPLSMGPGFLLDSSLLWRSFSRIRLSTYRYVLL